MNSKLTRWGNSLGIRIPKQIAEQARLSEGDEIEISQEGNKIILTSRKKSYSLDELLEGMTEEHLHSEVDWGKPEGKEQW